MNYAKLRDTIIAHEGLRLKPYRDTTGKLTIGVGRNLDDVGISPGEATFLLNNDLYKAIAAAQTFAWFDRLNDARQIVVVSMAFNLGLRGFSGFRKMIAALEAGDYEIAAREMPDSQWATQVGQRAIELSDMMRSGVS